MTAMEPLIRSSATAGGSSSAPTEPLLPVGPRLPPLTQYLRVILRRRWLILAVVLGSLAVATVLTILTTRQYTAVSTIEIQREGDRIVKLEGVEREASDADLEFYQTQYGLLKARSLADRITKSSRLVSDKKFVAAFGLERAMQQLRSEDARNRLVSDVLLANVKVTPVRASRLVTIAFTSPDPAVSASVANAWGRNFIEANLERRFDSTAYARSFLEGRLEQLRARLEESERQLVTYAGSQQIINIPSATATASTQPSAGERSIVADNLVSLNTELSAATADRIRAQSRLQGARGAASPEVLANPAIGVLRQKRAEVAADYAKLMVQFEPGYPQAQALARQQAQLDASIAREEGRVRDSLAGNYREALAREQDLTTRVAALKQGLLDLRRRSIQYNIYQREVDTNRQLYDGLLQRYKEIGVAGGVGNNNISVVDRAETPQVPSKPNVFANLALALLAGLGLGVGLAFVREQIDEAVTDPDDVQRSIGLPLLGTVPNLRESTPIEALQDRKSGLAEAYLSIQTSLEFTTARGAPKTLAVTSTRPAEGKSSSAYAIALTMARARRMVVLIDCDMRSPSVHQLIGVPRGNGVSNFLAGTDDLAGLVRATEIENLSMMSAGPQPPNAAELLTGDRFAQLLTRLTERYDHVVVDAPPVMGLADAPLIASRVDATAFVIESHQTRTGLVNLALGRLRSANANIVGVILSRFDSKRAHYGYGYDYGYGYGETRPETSSAS